MAWSVAESISIQFRILVILERPDTSSKPSCIRTADVVEAKGSRRWGVRGADNGRTGSGFVSNTTTFKANGGYSLILYGLCQGSYSDFGDKRRVQVYLDAKSGELSSDIVDGTSINPEKIAKLVSNSLQYGVVVEFNG